MPTSTGSYNPTPLRIQTKICFGTAMLMKQFFVVAVMGSMHPWDPLWAFTDKLEAHSINFPTLQLRINQACECARALMVLD